MLLLSFIVAVLLMSAVKFQGKKVEQQFMAKLEICEVCYVPEYESQKS
jgi:hypothetical protein